MPDNKYDFDIASLDSSPAMGEGDSREVSNLIRDLLNRIEQLEDQNSTLRKAIEVLQTPPSPQSSAPPRPRSTTDAPRKKKPLPGSRRSILGTTASPGVAAFRQVDPAPEPPSPTEPPPEPSGEPCHQANDLRQLSDENADEQEPVMMKRSGRVRSKFRRQFRYFSMVRLHAILAGLCMAMGAISGAVAQMLSIPILQIAGIVFACLGVIYMVGVGIAWFALGVVFASAGSHVAELPPSVRYRPGQSLISNLICAISKLVHGTPR